jgi:diguanylate cyclase (GGDEF)-like protein
MDRGDRPPQLILCVDDDEDVRQILQEVVGHLGHTGATAADGLDALEKLTADHFDIVITDLKMPEMDGIELIRRIRAEFTDVDVIAVTGHHTEFKYTDVIEAGACDFISKPFHLNELEAKINRIVRERELRADLKWLSTRDGLTGLYNRRYFDENLRHEVIRAFRQNYSLYLLFIDLDGLKGYNDKYGHQKGDTLLIELAEIIQDNIRNNVDSAFRYGGDEFAVVLPYADQQQALLVAERLLSKFNDRNLSLASISVGMAKLEGSSETLESDFEELIRKADQALYRAKASGGNRVWAAEVPVTITNPSPR